MTHDELLTKINSFTCCSGVHELAIRAVVELHKQGVGEPYCSMCDVPYPCSTIWAIEKELK